MEIVIVRTVVELLLAFILIVALGFISVVFFEAHRRRHNNAYLPPISLSSLSNLTAIPSLSDFFLIQLHVFQARRSSGDVPRPQVVETGTVNPL